MFSFGYGEADAWWWKRRRNECAFMELKLYVLDTNYECEIVFFVFVQLRVEREIERLERVRKRRKNMKISRWRLRNPPARAQLLSINATPQTYHVCIWRWCYWHVPPSCRRRCRIVSRIHRRWWVLFVIWTWMWWFAMIKVEWINLHTTIVIVLDEYNGWMSFEVNEWVIIIGTNERRNWAVIEMCVWWWEKTLHVETAMWGFWISFFKFYCFQSTIHCQIIRIRIRITSRVTQLAKRDHLMKEDATRRRVKLEIIIITQMMMIRNEKRNLSIRNRHSRDV